jgi:hypothetical protein
MSVAGQEAPRVAIVLAGPIASGKTTVGKMVAESLRAPRLSFGRFVADGEPDVATREQLQVAGSSLIVRLGAQEFVRAVLGFNACTPGDVPAVWDGLRHLEVLRALEQVYAPHPVVLCFLDPPAEPRRQRALADAGSAERLRRWEADPTEVQLGLLRQAAHVVCEDATPTEAAKRILDRCRRVE